MITYLSVPDFFGESDVNRTQRIHRKVCGFVPTHSNKNPVQSQRKILFVFFLISFLSLSY